MCCLAQGQAVGSKLFGTVDRWRLFISPSVPVCVWTPRHTEQHAAQPHEHLEDTGKRANYSQHRVWNYFFACWFAKGRNSCSWSMGCGDRSIAFFKRTPIKQWEITVGKERSMIECREVEHPVKSKAPTPDTKRRNSSRKVDELSDVHHVVTSAKPFQFKAQPYIS